MMKEATKRNIWWGFALLVMGIIFFFSADTAAASDAKSSLFVDWLYPFVSMGMSENHFSFLIRKAAHFSIYALLGLCVYNGCVHDERMRTRAFWIAVGICFLYAAGDEMHQLFSNGRSAQISDVLLDTCGALFGAALAKLWRIVWQKRKSYDCRR